MLGLWRARSVLFGVLLNFRIEVDVASGWIAGGSVFLFWGVLAGNKYRRKGRPETLPPNFCFRCASVSHFPKPFTVSTARIT